MQNWCADKACTALIQVICMLRIDIGRCLTPFQRAIRDRYAVQSCGTHLDNLGHHPAEDGRVDLLGNAKGALPKHPIQNQRVLQQAHGPEWCNGHSMIPNQGSSSSALALTAFSSTALYASAQQAVGAMCADIWIMREPAGVLSVLRLKGVHPIKGDLCLADLMGRCEEVALLFCCPVPHLGDLLGTHAPHARDLPFGRIVVLDELALLLSLLPASTDRQSASKCASPGSMDASRPFPLMPFGYGCCRRC